MTNEQLYNKEIHDSIIENVYFDFKTSYLIFTLNENKEIIFSKVILFRTESFVSDGCLSSPFIYISTCDILYESWLLSETHNNIKPNGDVKWHNKKDHVIPDRTENALHINIYCIDWEYDIICCNTMIKCDGELLVTLGKE